MIRPTQLVHKNAERLYGSTFNSSNFSAKRVLFDVYITFLKCGLLSKESLVFKTLLDNTPTKYYPCTPNMVDSYSVSTLTLQNTFNKYVGNINLEISKSDEEALVKLHSLLPLTTDQANSYLIQNEVIDNQISTDGIMFLLGSVCKSGVVKVPIVIYDSTYLNTVSNGERTKRNSNPSVFLILPSSMKQAKVKNHFVNVIRAVRSMTSQVGFVIPELICSSLPLMDSGKNILTPDLLTSILSERKEFEFLSDKLLVVSDIDSSELIRLLTLLVGASESLPTKLLCDFFKSFFEYKHMYSRSKGTKSVVDKNSKTSFAKISNDFDISVISTSILTNMIDLSKLLTVEENGKSISISSTAVNSNVFSDLGYWMEFYLDFISATTSSQSASFESLLQMYSARVRNKYMEALRSENDFFSISNGIVSVSESNIVFSKNRSGEFVQPDFDYIVDSISLTISKLDELKAIGQSNFEVYQMAFLDKWKPKKGSHAGKRTMLELYLDEEYCEDLKEWLTQSKSQLAVNYINSDIGICQPLISSISSRLKYMKGAYDNLSSHTSNNANALHDSIKSASARLQQWQLRVDKNMAILNDVAASSMSLKESNYHKEIEALEVKRKQCRIPTRFYEAQHKIQSWVVENGGELPLDDVNRKVDELCAMLGSKKITKSSSDYHTLYNFYNYHPFKVARTK